jgi:hypothetical protein
MYWISSRGQPTKHDPPVEGLCGGLRTTHRERTCLLRNVTWGLRLDGFFGTTYATENASPHFGRVMKSWRM